MTLDTRKRIGTLRPVKKAYFPALPQTFASQADRFSPAPIEAVNQAKGKVIRLKRRVMSPEAKLLKSNKPKNILKDSGKGSELELGRLAAYREELLAVRQAWFSSRRALLQLLKRKLKGLSLESLAGDRLTVREVETRLEKAGIRVQTCVLEGLATEGRIDVSALLLELRQTDILPSRPKPLLSLTSLPAIHLYSSHYDRSISDREGFFSLSPGTHLLLTERSNEEAFRTEEDMTVSAQGSPPAPGRPKSVSSSNSSNFARA